MSEIFYATGSFDWRNGTFTTEDLPYVLGRPGDTDQPVLGFHDGSANVYGLDDVNFYGIGDMAFYGGSAAIFLVQPFGGFEDFAIFPETGDDPLDGFVVAAQAGNSASIGETWSRHYVVAVPPKKTRFAVPHIKLGTLTDVNKQYLDGHQLEVLQIADTAPSDFISARALQVMVRPKRLNYATGSTTVDNLVPGRAYTASAYINDVRESVQFVAVKDTYTLFPTVNLVTDPGFERTTAEWIANGWVGNAGGTISKDTTHVWKGSQALKVIATTDNWGYFPMDGTTHGAGTNSSPNPTHTIGQVYTASVWVYVETAQSLRLKQYGTNPVTPSPVAVAANTWTQLSVTWTAGTDVFLSVRNAAGTATGTFWMDGFQIEEGPDLTPVVYSLNKILVEEGAVLGDYFDGDSGDDYLWEQGGTPGATRSYYYPDRSIRHEILVRTLQENVALGIQVEDPIYATLPRTSST